MIHLRHEVPVAFGSNNLVYDHPDDSTVLIKVVRPEAVKRAGRYSGMLRGRRRRFYHLKNFIRPMEEQVAVLAKEGQRARNLEEIVGLVNTDLGPGLAVRRESLGAELAPDIRKLLDTGDFKPGMLALVREFLGWLEYSPIIVNDAGLRNIVLSDRTGELRFVLIDGYGEAAAVPFKSWSRSINRWDKQRKCQWIWKQVANQ